MSPSPKPSPEPTEPLYTSENYSLEDSLGRLIADVSRRLQAAIDVELAGMGMDITAAQWGILMRIANGCGSTAAQLCRFTHYDTGSMTRMLNRLEAKGFIRRVRSQTDRRVVLLEVTAAGKALKPMITQRMVEIMNRFLIGFQRQDLEQLKSLLQLMLKNA